MAKRLKKNKNNINVIITFLFSLVVTILSALYFSLNYVPKELYEEQVMRPGMREVYYVSQWCSADFGKQEFMLWDKTRVDCLTKDYAIEFDFAKKWAESVGQSLYYAKMTGKQPAVALILTDIKDYRYVKRIERLENGIKIFIIKAY
ncbi:hypothetical protein HDR58_09890 [bacterium]|nr:hypothetical protein [bacterium]